MTATTAIPTITRVVLNSACMSPSLLDGHKSLPTRLRRTRCLPDRAVTNWWQARRVHLGVYYRLRSPFRRRNGGPASGLAEDAKPGRTSAFAARHPRDDFAVPGAVTQS